MKFLEWIVRRVPVNVVEAMEHQHCQIICLPLEPYLSLTVAEPKPEPVA